MKKLISYISAFFIVLIGSVINSYSNEIKVLAYNEAEIDVWDGSSNILWYINGVGSEQQPYQISTPEDLAGLAAIVDIGKGDSISYNTVTITGKGQYKGKIVKTFNIVASTPQNSGNGSFNDDSDTTSKNIKDHRVIIKGDIDIQKAYQNNEDPFENIRVYVDNVYNGPLQKDIDYTYTYYTTTGHTINGKLKSMTITITFIGEYEGTYKQTFKADEANNTSAIIIVSILAVALCVVIAFVVKKNKNNKKIESEEIEITDKQKADVKEAGIKAVLEDYLENEKITKEEHEKYLKLLENEKIDKIPEEIIEEADEMSENYVQSHKENIIKRAKEYINSPKAKFTLTTKISLCIVGFGALLFVIALIIGSNGLLTTAGVFILIPLVIIWFCVTAMKRCCPICGHKGEICDSHFLGSTQKIERKKILDNYTTISNAKGHISYDKDGNPYEEQIVTTSIYEKTLKCTSCGYEWKMEVRKQEK